MTTLPLTPDRWLLEQYERSNAETERESHERRPLLEVLDDHEDDECGAGCEPASGDATWPRPRLWADLDAIEAARHRRSA